MNKITIENYSRLKISLFLYPLLLLSFLVGFILFNKGFSIAGYTGIQKEYFIEINSFLSRYPNLMHELTQFGDALILFSTISIFIVYAPKTFEVLLIASLILLVGSFLLKNLFAIPRPAAIYLNSDFTIIGRVLKGRNSFPSGHSMTIFMTITILMFAFTPQKKVFKILWYVLMICLGGFIAISRIGVGAHYPFDVLTGCILGYLIALIAIFINRKYNLWGWLKNKKYYPFQIVIYASLIIALIFKILNDNLIVFYVSILGLIITLYKTTELYVKR
jgi:membrane-associated phospholipid phosphatase